MKDEGGKKTGRPPAARLLHPSYFRLPPSRNGDRESGRFSRLPANRCALEVRSTTSSTYEFPCALTAVLRLQFVCSPLLSSGEEYSNGLPLP
jgi:hypothetical protein